MTTTMTEQDLYNIVLRRREAYILFLARESSDISVLPKPLTQREENLYEYCCIGYDTDDNTSYTKTIPANVMPYASLDSIGGKTIVWNQLADLSTVPTSSVNGITFTNNGDGSITVSGELTSTGAIISLFTNVPLIPSHIYMVRGCPSGGSVSTYRMNGGMFGDTTIYFNDLGDGLIKTAPNGSPKLILQITISGAVGDTFNLKFYPQYTDLTLMFGAGNEPTTVQEFIEQFPAQYYQYTQGQLLSAGVTKAVSKDANNTTIDTMPIPAEVQALTGYGWSAGSVYNYIDYERKVFVKRVGSVDLGDLTWVQPNISYPNLWYAEMTGRKDGNVGWVGYPMDYLTYQTTWAGIRDTDKSWTINTVNSSYPKRLYINDSNYASMTGTQVASALAGKIAYYELATPIETDISQYLTDDYIAVEGGGTITFENQNGDDYRIPVQSSETYTIDRRTLQE